MKKLALILGMAGAMAVLSACSDEKSEVAEYKENFVNTCVVHLVILKVKRQKQ
ncbi:hypothetical protein [Providencia huaxiensis]|uniref:hypothetical protein n=1 Tax=Providencia huaxiensis TaxID=2027290 RepID=UPI00331F3327